MDVQTSAVTGPARPKRRWKRVLIGVLVLLVLAALGSGIGIVTYEPLREGSVGGLSGPTQIERQEGVREQASIVTYESGSEMILTFGIRNDGLVGVTIEEIVGRDFGLFQVSEVRRQVAGRCCIDTEPFAPFSLGRDEDRFVQLRGTLRGCGDHAPGSSVAWGDYTVRYRILGVTRTTEVQTRSPVIIRIPETFQCTEPPRPR